jgi:hypothetical protein
MLIGGPGLLDRIDAGHRAFDGAAVRLAPGTSVSSFTTEAQQLASRFPETGGGVLVADQATQAAEVQHAIRPEAVALAIFAVLAGVVAFVAIGQLLVRQMSTGADETPVYRALGMTRQAMFAIVLAPVAITAVVGAIVAVAVAAVASRWMPIGPARLAEPHLGVSFDWSVFGLGALAIVAIAMAIALLPAWLTTRSPEPSVAASANRRVTRFESARAILPVSVAVGMTPVTSSRWRSAALTGGTFVGVAVAIGAIAAAITFGLNLSRLVDTPRLYGQTWSITADA